MARRFYRTKSGDVFHADPKTFKLPKTSHWIGYEEAKEYFDSVGADITKLGVSKGAAKQPTQKSKTSASTSSGSAKSAAADSIEELEKALKDV